MAGRLWGVSTEIIIFGIIVLLILFYIISTYNQLVRARNRVRNQWSQVDVQLKKRFDLIPNLVDTVKGYASHEKNTLESVIRARNKAVAAVTPGEAAAAEGELNKALGRLLALTESYPDLKANTNFVKLQDELSGLENKIAHARQFYNDTVMKYQNKREMFPTNIVAAVFGFKQAEYFTAEENERKNVKVTF